MANLSAETLREVSQRILESVGTPSDSAKLVSDSLVQANLVGHDSHGVIRLLRYVPWVYEGYILPKAKPTIRSQNGAAAQIDGANGWGQAAARLATETVIRLAKHYGIAVATISSCNHIGRLGEYMETIANAGMIGFALCNSATAVAPYGGRQRVFGTNPLAWGAPRSKGHEPLIIDFATAAVAEGKLRVAMQKGEKIQPDLLLTADGHPTQDPADFYSGGALLPFGGHKGYGLSLMIELLGRALTNQDSERSSEYRGANGTLLLAVNIVEFTSLAMFLEQSEQLCETVKSSPPAEGFKQVLLPGEPEILSRREHLASGITIPDEVWKQILALENVRN